MKTVINSGRGRNNVPIYLLYQWAGQRMKYHDLTDDTREVEVFCVSSDEMFVAKLLVWFLPTCTLASRSTFSGTMVDFTDPKVQGHLDALVRMAQACVIKVRASPKDVRAYFTNSPPITRSGQCFAACMLEQSDVINHGKINRDLLIHLAGLVNGKNSRVVRKLHSISRLCLDSIDGMSDRCQLASTYNDCLNENMTEFAFPLDIAEEAVRKMPFHLIQPNLPQELRQSSF